MLVPLEEYGLGVQIAVPEDTLWGWQYHDVVWAYDSTMYKHMIWMPADNYQLAPACPLSMVDEACGYENLTGTVIILFSRLLCCPGNAEVNALQMRPGERWVMGFLLELWYQKELDNRVDGWPKKTYGTSSNDSSWWPKLAIDLTNPPSTIPGQTTPDTVTTSGSNRVDVVIDRSHDTNPDFLYFWIYTAGAFFDPDNHIDGMEFHIWDANGAG